MTANASSVGMMFLTDAPGDSRVSSVGLMALVPSPMFANVSMVGIMVLVDALPSKIVLPESGSMLSVNYT